MDSQQRKKRTPVKGVQTGKRKRLISVDVGGVDYNFLRMLMGERYVHDQKGASIRAILTAPEFANVEYATAEKWCVKDGWVEQRRKLHEEVHNRVTNALIDELTKERIDHLRKLIAVRNLVDDAGMLTNDKGEIQFKLQPKSLESWVMAKVKLDQHIAKVQSSVATGIPQVVSDAVVPGSQTENLPMSLKPRLTEEESLDLALRLRDKRLHEDEEAVIRWKASQTLALPAAEVPVAKKKKPPPVDGQ